MTKTIEELTEIRQSLEFANECPNSCINDTLWMVGRPQTIFDAIDSLIEELKTQTILSQGEPTISKMEIVEPASQNLSFGKSSLPYGSFSNDNLNIGEKLYTSPQSTEALQKDKEELIEYAKKLLIELDGIYGLHKCTEEMRLIKYAQTLDNPKPKCME